MFGLVFKLKKCWFIFETSSRVFQRELPLKDSGSIPKPVVFIVGKVFLFLDNKLPLHVYFHVTPIQAMD